MKSKSLIAAAGASALLVCTQIASAHPGHGSTTGFAAGVSHPFTGVDHILAMIAVGLCAAQLGGRALWLLPAAFLACMVGGGWLGIHGGAVPMLEQAIAASVLVLGLLIAAGARVSLPATAVLVAVFGAFHGYAHGAEMGAGLTPALYGLGFLTATVALNAIGLGSGLLLMRNRRIGLSRLTGGAIALGGLLLVCIA
jgi:urease accessory protein